MAERSKALVLGTSLLGGVGSNPTPIISFFIFFKVVGFVTKPETLYQRIGAAEARWAHNPKVPGSKPGFANNIPPSSVGRAQDS